jgi:alanyl-tRNA synthetase
VTVFGGEDGIPADDEARGLWSKLAGVPDSRILSLGKADNFWAMGETGPCGPCSEIHFHIGDDTPCAEVAAGRACKGPACDCDRWMEIWNLVFMQFERKTAGGPLEPLPAPSIDTGMGLERLSAVLEGVRSNYETALFRPLIARAEELTKTKFVPLDYAGSSVSLRAMADHARATAFLIADGVSPDKNGREYVLRRIMRRAIYHGFLLGVKQPFLHELCNLVIEQMGGTYSELRERQKAILSQVQNEEERFRETLDRGLRVLGEVFARAGAKVVGGPDAFKLYDTFGFPIDLTRVIAEQHGFAVDEAGFEAAMEEQRGRSSFVSSGEAATEEVWVRLASKLGKSRFQGYDGVVGSGKVLAIVAGGKEVEAASAGVVQFVCDATPFYGEQGGQIGDQGMASGPDLSLRVTDTQKPSDLTVHVAEIVTGELRVGQSLELVVDAARRAAIRRNHSATHLLHLALRSVLGEHVAQKGSLVAPDRLRFDFSHFAPLSAAERARIEELVNERILLNVGVVSEELALEEAKKKGAIAFFKITTEAGVAQGVRRLEAVTGDGARGYVAELERELLGAASLLRAPAFQVVDRVEKLQKELRERDKAIEDLKAKLAGGGARDLMSTVRDVGGIKVLAARTEVGDPKALREVGDQLRDKLGSGVVVLGGVDGDKVALVALVTKDLVGKVKAGDIVKALSAAVGGKGGGRPDMAQGGGTDVGKLDEALELTYAIVAAAV